MLTSLTSIAFSLGSAAYQWGWPAKTAACIYAAPIATWTLGCGEGAIRAAFHLLASAFSKVSARHDIASEQFNRFKRDGAIAMSCGTMAAFSAIPIVGTGVGDLFMLLECLKFMDLKEALEKALQEERENAAIDALKDLDKFEIIDQKTLEQITQTILNSSSSSHLSRLPESVKDYKASLIHHYYCYSVIYLTAEYTCRGVHFTAKQIQDLALFVFKSGLLRKVLKSALNAVQNEIAQALHDTAFDQRFHPVFKQTNSMRE